MNELISKMQILGSRITDLKLRQLLLINLEVMNENRKNFVRERILSNLEMELIKKNIEKDKVKLNYLSQHLDEAFPWNQS